RGRFRSGAFGGPFRPGRWQRRAFGHRGRFHDGGRFGRRRRFHGRRRFGDHGFDRRRGFGLFGLWLRFGRGRRSLFYGGRFARAPAFGHHLRFFAAGRRFGGRISV